MNTICSFLVQRFYQQTNGSYYDSKLADAIIGHTKYRNIEKTAIW